MIGRRRIAEVSVMVAGLLIATRVFSQQPTGNPNGLQGAFPISELDSSPPAQQAQARIAQYEAAHGIPRAATAQFYPFFPHAGSLWQDLYLNNFVDLGDGTAPLDFDCTGYTYIGHTGHDSDIYGFREQSIGVPIFAALDGTVVDAHDGEDDMNTQWLGQPANYVILDHGGLQSSLSHWHMRKNSVAVSPGQVVPAGTQIGSTGSSGNSTWPHLHFESQLGGGVYQPSAGPCRPGASNWVTQVPIRFTGVAALPWDQVTRTGSFVAGFGSTYFRVQVVNIPPQSTYRVRYVRPDGSVSLDDSGTFDNPGLYRDTWFWFQYNWTLDTVGTWDALLDINGVTVADAPFFVVASPLDIVDHPPNPIGASLDPPAPTSTDVVFCRVATPLYLRDPDYELVSYEDAWDVNGTIIRDVISAGLADAIPRGFDQPGDTLTCTVTPRDDSASGPSTSASAVIQTAATGGRR